MTFFGPDIRNGVPVGLGSVAGFGRRAFTPAVLFAQGEPGAWYDPSDYSTLYQDSAGTTPVTAVEQAVGLALDKSRGLRLGNELATTTSFTGVAIGGPSVTTYDTGAPVFAGRTYLLRVTITGYTGSQDVGFSSGAFGALARATANGTYEWRVVATADNNALMFTRSTNTCNYSNISVRELPGTHLIQPSASSRPILRARYNRIIYSEDLTNGAWSKLLSGTAPTATTFNFASTFGSGFEQTITVAAGVTLTASFEAAGTGTIQIVIVDGSGAFGSTATTVNLTSTPTRYSVTRTTADANAIIRVRNTSGSAVTGATCTKLQFVSANDTYLPYQRIAAATDYDTVGFPVYLAFDGSDDSMYTGGNLVPGTDKAQVLAGITKLSDAAQGIVAELSATVASNNGTFLLAAPDAADATFGWDSKGTNQVDAVAGSVAAPRTAVLIGTGDIAGDSAIIYVDNVAADTDTGDQGTGDYGSYPLYVGRRNNTSGPFNGRLYSLIVRFGPNLLDALRTQAGRWIAQKQGRTL